VKIITVPFSSIEVVRFRIFEPLLALGLAFSCIAFQVRADVALKEVAGGFVSPTVLAPLPDGSGRLLLADQVGPIYVLGSDGKPMDKLFLDLRSKLAKLSEGFDERGVLGLALHPKFRENRKLYIAYSAPLRPGGPTEWDHTSHISEFRASSDGLSVDPATERVLLQIDQPYFNHNGGRLAFGPDGFLYISVGDGGNANDRGRGHSPQGNGQDLTTLLGKILRIDVNSGEKYGIPLDNPFVKGDKGRPEIFAYGLRNPWGLSFDRDGTHELFVADVGQNLYEEVNIVVKGGNYGWNIREGLACFDPMNPNKSPDDCPKVGANGEPLLDPILVYKNLRNFPKDPEGLGISVTGGYVYRGKAKALEGKYVFADWSKIQIKPEGVLFAGTRGANGWSMKPLSITSPGSSVGAYITALGQDTEGELYLLTSARSALTGQTGKVLKIVSD
jgi:hypothetical protein